MELIFDKNIDKIVYFFEVIDYNTVFIEDLDRFDHTEIFTKLRELNTILNNYDLITRRIVFAYAVRDDMFVENEITKFFDFVIQVILIINSTNSGEILRKKLNVIRKDNGTFSSSKYNISSKYIILISPYIENMRILTSIYNEFQVYSKTLRDSHNLDLKDENMFLMMVFKNLYPKDFAMSEAERGIVKQAFEDKCNFIRLKGKCLMEKNQKLQYVLYNIKNDIMKDLREVKIVFLNYLVGDNKILESININSTVYTFDQFVQNDFDLNQIKIKKFSVKYYERNRSYLYTNEFENIQKKLNEDGENYLERCNNLIKSTTEKQEKIRKEIEKNERQRASLHSFSLGKLIEEYSVEEDSNLIGWIKQK